MTALEAALDEFGRAYGRRPDGVWSAPGRANLIGEFTDYNDGFVLPFALAWSARAAVGRRDDGLFRVASLQRDAGTAAPSVATHLSQLAPGATTDWPAYPLGVAWALGEATADLGGADILIDSDVPIGAGLSSSAAIECSIALALRDLYELPLTRPELAAAARRAENEYVGVPTGVMDQMASLCCAAGHALFLDTRSFGMRQVPLELADADLALLLVNTGRTRSLAGSAYADRREDCRRAAAQLGVAMLRDVPSDDLDTALDRLADPVLRRRVHHVVSEDARVLEVVRLLDAGQPAAIGPVLSAGHRSLAEDYEVSSPELDLVVDVALDHGALGARMTGGGFGGTALVLVEAATVPEVTRAVTRAFAGRDLPPPTASPVEACDGASRLA